MRLLLSLLVFFAVHQGPATAEEVRFFEPGEATAEDLLEAMAGPSPVSIGATRGLPGASSETVPTQSGGTVGYRIQFDFDSDRISERDAPFLSEIARMLAFPEMRDRILVIEGHTDAVGSETYNLNLSKRRALSVRNYLTDRYGIDPLTLHVIGRGEAKPIEPWNPESDANRRVQFYLR
ncbi:MAG: OmpA family protein [Alphaproteobacteria bacterium]|nr:OmpA family protein [Alphaproteobacteria bacterium]